MTFAVTPLSLSLSLSFSPAPAVNSARRLGLGLNLVAGSRATVTIGIAGIEHEASSSTVLPRHHHCSASRLHDLVQERLPLLSLPLGLRRTKG